MPKLTEEDVKLIEVFWDAINRIKTRIMNSGAGGGYQPHSEDYWDTELSKSYDAIDGFFQKVSKWQVFRVPVGVAALAPFGAKNAHQALMFFLNPPVVLEGHADVLSSTELRSIESRAQDELHRIGASVAFKTAEKPKTRNRRMRRAEKVARLTAEIQSRSSEQATITQAEVAGSLGWAQGTVSKIAETLPDGWEGLLELMSDYDPRRGLRTKNGDDLIVDGVVDDDD